jgi:uncharacterized membrane protein (DUF485 family)
MSSAKFYILSISARSIYKNMKLNTLILLSLVRIKYIIRRKVGELWRHNLLITWIWIRLLCLKYKFTRLYWLLSIVHSKMYFRFYFKDWLWCYFCQANIKIILNIHSFNWEWVLSIISSRAMHMKFWRVSGTVLLLVNLKFVPRKWHLQHSENTFCKK